jgi:regulator of protease activity HflC (stomatin/prohibitin superfamily)
MEGRHISTTRISVIIGGVIAAIVVLALGNRLVETNNAGYYQVKQSFPAGNMSVRNEASMYGQWLGDITQYQLSTTVDFTGEKSGAAEEDGVIRTAPLAVTFQGNSTAQVSGVIKYQLSKKTDTQLKLHELYRGNDAIAETLVRQTVAEATKLAGPVFTPEEARTTRREEFTSLVRDMLEQGIFATKSKMTTVLDDDGRKRQVQVTELKLDKDGNRQVIKQSPLKDYDIQIVQFVVRGFAFDKVTQDLMMAKKQAEQEKVVARANAEKAKQDAITAEEQGKAKVATAKAEKLVEKIKAVTDAQKAFEVAEFKKKETGELAKAKILAGEAEARVARQKVAAGLTPLEKAEIEMKTRIGMAEAWSKRPVPAMIMGGSNGKGSGGGADTALQVMGVKAMLDMTQSIERNVKTQTHNGGK